MSTAKRTLVDAATIVRGVTFPTSEKHFEPDEGRVACLRTTNVQREVEWVDLWYIPNSYVRREEQQLQLGDVLISNANSYELVGKVALIKALPQRATLGAFIGAIRAKPGVIAAYLYYHLASPETQAAIRNLASTTTNISNVSMKKLEGINVMIPSEELQQQVVDELDLQFSRLDAAVAALKRAQANLKRYRASVLQAAVTGRLVPTEHDLAQAEGRDYETGEQLLERILTERRRTWSGKGKYREPVAPSCAICWTPDGWATGTVAQVSAIIVDCPHSTAKFISEGKPCVDTTCIEPGRIKMEKLRFVSEATYIERIARLAPQADDLIFAREGTVGTAVRIPSGLSPCLGQRVMLMRPAECINPKYFEHCLNSEVVRKQYKSQLLGSTVPHLNVADAKELVLPLPPLAEQARIVEEVERRLSVADRLEATLETNLRRATGLRQAILKKAFTFEDTEANA